MSNKKYYIIGGTLALIGGSATIAKKIIKNNKDSKDLLSLDLLKASYVTVHNTDGDTNASLYLCKDKKNRNIMVFTFNEETAIIYSNKVKEISRENNTIYMVYTKRNKPKKIVISCEDTSFGRAFTEEIMNFVKGE